MIYGGDKTLCGFDEGEVSLGHVVPFIKKVRVGEFVGLGGFDPRVEVVISGIDGGHIFGHGREWVLRPILFVSIGVLVFK